MRAGWISYLFDALSAKSSLKIWHIYFLHICIRTAAVMEQFISMLLPAQPVAAVCVKSNCSKTSNDFKLKSASAQLPTLTRKVELNVNRGSLSFSGV